MVFPRQLLGWEVDGRPCPQLGYAPRCLFRGSQNTGARRPCPQAPAPAEAPVAEGEGLELPTAARQRSREGVRGSGVRVCVRGRVCCLLSDDVPAGRTHQLLAALVMFERRKLNAKQLLGASISLSKDLPFRSL